MRLAITQAIGLQGFESFGSAHRRWIGATRRVSLAAKQDLGAWIPERRGETGWGGAHAPWLEPLTMRLASLGLSQLLMVVHGELAPQDAKIVKTLQDQQVAMAQIRGMAIGSLIRQMRSRSCWSQRRFGQQFYMVVEGGGAPKGSSASNTPLARRRCRRRREVPEAAVCRGEVRVSFVSFF